MRAVVYARYSTGNQSPLSIDDQQRLNRAKVAALGAHVVREFTDPEISGFTGARPGYQALLAFVRAGHCDLVVCEHSNRMARDGEAGWHVFNLFRGLGVRYATVQEGDMTVIGQGISTLMSEAKGEETSRFTYRGLAGVVQAGRSAGGLSYGYRVKRTYDARGEPVRGLLEVDEAAAEIVRRIHREYAAGTSPLALCAALNAEGVPGPRGGLWNVSSIIGNARRGHGVLHNELYVGVRVWGRRTFVKDRATGMRRGRDAPDEAEIREPVPELRILSDDDWAATRAQHARLSAIVNSAGTQHTRRPKRFLQGLIKCADCGGTMQRAGPRDALRCATRIAKGACGNTKVPGYAAIEARVFDALRGFVLRPDAVELAIATINAALEADRRHDAKRQAKAAAELAEVKRRASRLLDQVAEGQLSGAAVAEKLAELDARRQALEAAVATIPAESDVTHLPRASARIWRDYVEQLSAALDAPQDVENREAAAAVRALIGRVLFIPRTGHNAYDLEIEGDLGPLLQMGLSGQQKAPGVVPGAFASTDCIPRSMGRMGAGTRTPLSHTLSAPFTQAA